MPNVQLPMGKDYVMDDTQKMIIGVIPARGGSKGIPMKNLRKVMGIPLIGHAIQCGLKCPLIDHLIVSTDSRKIAEVAVSFGAELPFIRPSHLAEDTTPMLPVLQHTIEKVESHYNKKVEFLILLDPTGPLRQVDDIITCISMLKEPGCDAVVSANKAHRSPYFNMVKVENGYAGLFSILENKDIGRRQDSQDVYDLNTVVWGYRREALMEEKKRIPKKTKLYLIPAERSIDIDTEFDLTILENILKECKQ